MAERPVSIEDIKAGIPIAALDRRELSYVELSDTEKKTISYVFDNLVASLRKVSLSVAADIEPQKELAINMAGVAKATFPVRKNYAFPSVPGSLGVAPLFPQGLKWVSSPSSSDPCYTSYTNNSWDITVTAGTASYLLGSVSGGTEYYYRANPNTEKHTFILIFDKGVIEVGSTPSIDQFQMLTEGKRDYGIYTVSPLVDIPLETGKVIYQYPTPLGAVFVSHDRGMIWRFMPRTSGTKTIKLIGLIYYEHDFMSNLKWVT